jgi:hypothetical protein
MASAQYYPLRTSDWFVNAGVGVSSYAKFLALPSNGIGVAFGTGIELKVSHTVSLTPAAQLVWGSSRDVRDNEQLLEAHGLRPDLIAIDVSATLHFRARKNRGGGIRTRDLLVPNQARYRTAPHPDENSASCTVAKLQSYYVERRSSTSISARNALPRCETRCLAAAGASPKVMLSSDEKNSGS